MIEILNTNYNDYVDIVGTAHFTTRSINEAYDLTQRSQPQDIALELDWKRFQLLNMTCHNCQRRASCRGLCEFTVAAKALGNVDANIWLIDMAELEMKRRVASLRSPFERTLPGHWPYQHGGEDPVWLWEQGFKERVINNSKRQIEVLRKVSPSVWRVLIDERNTVMAARLAWIATTNLAAGKHSKILGFVGAAHVEGITALLTDPILIKENLRNFNLPFKEPTLIRRVAIRDE